jgi:hypothetical protein
VRYPWHWFRDGPRPERAYRPGDWVEVDTRWNGGLPQPDFRPNERGRVRYSFESANYPAPSLCWIIRVPLDHGGFSDIWARHAATRPYRPTAEDEGRWILAELTQ